MQYRKNIIFVCIMDLVEWTHFSWHSNRTIFNGSISFSLHHVARPLVARILPYPIAKIAFPLTLFIALRKPGSTFYSTFNPINFIVLKARRSVKTKKKKFMMRTHLTTITNNGCRLVAYTQ